MNGLIRYQIPNIQVFLLKDEGDNDFYGNFWDEWISPDANNDEIVDEKYPLAGEAYNFDHSPFTQPRNPYRFHFISRFSITLPSGGVALAGTITIKWIVPVDSFDHSLTYDLTYSADGGINWNQLALGQKTNSYPWDTTTTADGTKYIIMVEAIDSEGLVTAALSETFTIKNIPETTDSSTTLSSEIESSTTDKTGTITPGFSGVIATLTFLGLTLIKYRKRHKER